MATSNITDQNLARLVTQAGDDALALQQIATFYGLSAGDLSQITGIPTKTYNKLFLDAGLPLGTVLTGDVPATTAQKANVKTIGKGDDLVVEKAVGKQGDKILVQQYDAYGNKTSTRLADPNTSEGKGWLQALGIVGLATFGPAAFEALGATGAGTSAAAAGEGVLAGTTAADIMAATEALEAAGATTLGGSAGVPAALAAPELAAVGAGAGVPAALGSTAPASLTVAASSLPAASLITPELAMAGVLGGAALTSGTSGTTPDVIDEYNVTGGQGTQIPGGGSLGSPTTVATTAAGASILKQLADATGISEDTLRTILKGGAGLLTGYASYRDAEAAREAARGKPFKSSSGYQTVTGAGGVTGFKKAASGGVMSVLNEKGPEDYGIGSLADREAFMEANMPAGEASQFDIYGNLIMPDTEFRTLTGSETNQLERDAAREYYKDPENARLSYEIAKNLEDAVIAKGGMGEVDVQETLRNIYNDPELKNMFFNYTGELKYAPMEAADLLDKDYELNKREAEGFTPDNNYIPGLAYELDRFNRDNPRIGRNLEFEMLKLVDPNAPRTFFRNYDYEEGEGNIRRGGGEGGGEGGIGGGYGGAAGGIASLQPKRKLPPRYLDGHSDGMADKVPANIDGKRPAALSDGEFVIPADVVSHLGNGNSNAGAKRLYKMMDDIRAARTGNPKQGKQINPDKFMPR
jgi:hypothetical protein